MEQTSAPQQEPNGSSTLGVEKIKDDGAFPSSSEQREPSGRDSALSDSASTSTGVGDSSLSTERNEPHHENASGLPCRGAVSTTDCSANGTTVVSSTEQREPKKKRVAKSLPRTGVLLRHKS
jgi:hypothetical protein